MKKLILSVAMLSLGSMAMSQGMYASFNVGYGFATPGDAIGTKEVTDASGNQTSTNIYGSLGAGLNLGLTPGYMFNEHVGFELGLNYLLGSETTTLDDTTPLSSDVRKSKSNQFRVIPTIVVSSGGDGLQVYGKAGLVLPVAGSTKSTVDITAPGNVTAMNITSKGAFTMGYTGALGVAYGLNEKLSLFGEVSHTNLRITSKTQTIESSTTNGSDNLAGAPAYFKETKFVDELNSSSNNTSYNSNTNLNAAKEELASKTNFNALFINLGVKFNF